MDNLLDKDLEKLEKMALKLGASAVKRVAVSSIRTGAWTRMKCQFGCPNYGKTLCCPPYAPNYETTQKFLAEYEQGIIVECTVSLPDGTDAAGWAAVDRQATTSLLDILLRLEREAFMMNRYRAFALKAGRCHLCEECNLKKCVHPTEARPSLEACGIDVFALANDNGFNMKVITGPISELKIYGLLLVD